ncbi:hypothetical protein KP509_12G026300 [Ceratopteris richardii]|uniref:Uncharacterized protein n=1 Tax=Ceratopteris richardii TaxID=49495 RepID=A0A8T2THF5_CERRI|nr:hypothetical protein KP509_12G026300 [Ceratopteris richardii]
MDTSSTVGPSSAKAAEKPKGPGFFRLLAQNASKNKQGFVFIMLAGSCFFLSMSMLDSKRQLQKLEDHYMSIKSENDELRNTIESLSSILYDEKAPSGTGVSKSTKSESDKKSFMI